MTKQQYSNNLMEMVSDYANEMIQDGFDEVDAYDISGGEMVEMLLNHGCDQEMAKEIVSETYGRTDF